MKELVGFDAVYIASGRDGDSFGLFDSWDSRLLTTSDPKVFMGGELCGALSDGSDRTGNRIIEDNGSVSANGESIRDTRSI